MKREKRGVKVSRRVGLLRGMEIGKKIGVWKVKVKGGREELKKGKEEMRIEVGCG